MYLRDKVEIFPPDSRRRFPHLLDLQLPTSTMGILDIVPVGKIFPHPWSLPLTFQPQAGVLTGDNVRKLFEYAKEHEVRFAPGSFLDPSDAEPPPSLPFQ